MNTYGFNLKLDIYGGSHDEKIGMTLDGIPAGEEIDFEALRRFMARRAPGNDPYSTKRKEPDEPVFLSGFDGNVTTGGRIEAIIYNKNQHSSDYSGVYDIPRPSHADFAAIMKYGHKVDLRGGGHFSGRLTAPMCIAGGICLQILAKKNIHVGAHILSVGKGAPDISFHETDVSKADFDLIHSHSFPTISEECGIEMKKIIEDARLDCDSVGGVVECAATGLPVGLGEHMFMGVEGRISAIVFGIPGVKGIEFGLGFGSAALRGSENNDPFEIKDGRAVTKTNNCGGILGGMTNGMPIIFRAAVKPTPSIAKEQDSISLSKMENTKLAIKGRHDPCIVPRAVPVFEAACALAVMDMLLDRNSNAEFDLNELRNEINKTDFDIVSLFKQRMDIVTAVAEYKKEHGLPILDEKREAALLERIASMAGDELAEYAKELYRTMMKVSRSYQAKKLDCPEE